jgi:glycosyltransferase involved in cell wall biosynthesis
MFQDMCGDVNVFISEYSKDKWRFNDITNSIVVHHMFNSDLFKPNEPRSNMILSVVNDFKNRDIFCGYSIYQNVVELVGKEHFILVGDNPGLSNKAKSTEELAEIYSSVQIFLNTSTVSPIPTSLLEAMSSGCAVVSTATCMIPEIIKNGVNGFISNDEEELAEYIQLLLNDSNLAIRLGEEARKTIINNFHKDRFTKVWEHVFRSICK